VTRGVGGGIAISYFRKKKKKEGKVYILGEKCLFSVKDQKAIESRKRKEEGGEGPFLG